MGTINVVIDDEECAHVRLDFVLHVTTEISRVKDTPFEPVHAGSTDPDVVWIVRENRKKARLARLL